MPSNLFVSYSHSDGQLVKPVVKLLRLNSEFVFYDDDSIQPGEKWRGEINNGLTEANLVVLFWCNHSSRSEEVKKEYSLALTQGKKVLPVLLDATPLPDDLSEFQWIDFRDLVVHATDIPQKNEKPIRRWSTGIAVVFVVAFFVVGYFFTFQMKSVRPELSMKSAQSKVSINKVSINKDTLTNDTLALLPSVDTSLGYPMKDTIAAIEDPIHTAPPQITDEVEPELNSDHTTPLRTILLPLFIAGSFLLIFVVAMRSWLKTRSKKKQDLPTNEATATPAIPHTELAAVLEAEILQRLSSKQ